MNKKQRKQVDAARVHLMYAMEILRDVKDDLKTRGSDDKGWSAVSAAYNTAQSALDEIRDIPME